MRPRMKHDNVLLEESERIEDEWKKSLFAPDTMRAIGNFIVKHRGGLPDEVCCPKAGSFNITFGMKLKDGGPAILRFLNPGIIMFLEEKVRNEVATMRYIQDHTAIPVPLVISSGTRGEALLDRAPLSPWNTFTAKWTWVTPWISQN
ncbi:hypothetical protein MAA_10653 [Metarhizium robertsii ARSEF 23]|uniref:Phosphotransferase enzyme family protein n=1 Tax=Metarhizium robertsii (strain ARSEF 23 / ATCC MYA-3075) TaxID=655844 RepID=A0A0B2XIF8_METRA|nr:uncharacterized protein MAA_10653 [Metarhizium robertsii ARSEF 23]KHO11709.1 hypothetical protein MAA_10653 [Metarhizium robertsii ARSEF 23]